MTLKLPKAGKQSKNRAKLCNLTKTSKANLPAENADI